MGEPTTDEKRAGRPGGMTLPGDPSTDTERIDVVEGEVGSANLKEPKDIEPVDDKAG